MLSIPTTATMGKDRCRRTERLLTKPTGSLPSLGALTAGSAAATHSAHARPRRFSPGLECALSRCRPGPAQHARSGLDTFESSIIVSSVPPSACSNLGLLSTPA